MSSTKAKTKAARRRAKRQITLAGGAVTYREPVHGPRPSEPPADQVALRARARRTGCSVEEARDVLASEPMGRCIRAMRSGAEERRALLTAWQGLCAAWENFCARCLSLSPSPQAAALPMLPDPMQTDQSLRVDLRTPDERDEAARRVWYEWLDLFMALPSDQRHALRGHLHGYGADLWCEASRAPTRHGALAVKALDALADRRK